MTSSPTFHVEKLGEDDIDRFRKLLDLYGAVFDLKVDYCSNQPGDTYLSELLGSECFISLVALSDAAIIGGLSAYILKKFEQPRSEMYIYDLAVREEYRRRGVATQLIQALQGYAKAYNCHVIFVQADHGDEPAMALYDSLGIRENVVHYDIPVF